MAFIDPTSSIVNSAEKLIYEIKNTILSNPHQTKFQDSDLARKLELEEIIVSKILAYISDVGRFWDSAAGSSGVGHANINVESDDSVNEYLNFDGLQNKFDEIATNIINRVSEKKSLRGKYYAPQNLEDLHETYESNTAFIIMSMNPQNHELEDVCNTIKEVCEKFDIKAFRVDDIEHSGVITELILQQIRRSEFLIADVTGERPNVYYEIGYAHAIGKRPIIVRKAGTPLHFDLSVHNIPEYKNITDLKYILKKRFEAIMGKSIDKD